ncbi:MAG: type II toxin-antitoxin system prevent-host-death family antitoxin [bacterium]|nr:type II toxin-antitoxin system prevent-host-death family antitoxin [bacterium]MDZ4232066.1 type II toxin-antitoxin system prevent-host-death family antitoxin [Candidatus Pacearchaeota archaeon]
MENIVPLRELRENMDKYAKRVAQGDTLVIVRRSKPLFRIAPLDEEWEEVIDFTKVRRGGVKIEELLSRL